VTLEQKFPRKLDIMSKFALAFSDSDGATRETQNADRAQNGQALKPFEPPPRFKPQPPTADHSVRRVPVDAPSNEQSDGYSGEDEFAVVGDSNAADQIASEGRVVPRELPGQPSENRRSYVITRTSKRSIQGKRYFFEMAFQQQYSLFAKARNSHPKGQVPICRTADVHLVGSCDYFLRPSNKSRTFELLKASDGERFFMLEILKDEVLQKAKIPCRRKLSFSQNLGLEHEILVSQRPRMSRKGYWFLDFHDRFTLPSMKNAIYVAEAERRNGRELITVRAIEKDRVEVNLAIDLPDFVVFGIGLASFLANYESVRS
jgi:hypothetical protein